MGSTLAGCFLAGLILVIWGALFRAGAKYPDTWGRGFHFDVRPHLLDLEKYGRKLMRWGVGVWIVGLILGVSPYLS